MHFESFKMELKRIDSQLEEAHADCEIGPIDQPPLKKPPKDDKRVFSDQARFIIVLKGGSAA